MDKKGFVYILTSPNSALIKIGGTEKKPIERIREINASNEYGGSGPWTLSDCLQVKNWRLVERGIHQHFKKKQLISKSGARELFRLPALTAREQLLLTDKELRIGYFEKTTRLSANYDLKVYLYNLFELTGLYTQYDIQGAWTFSLFPATGRCGRYFTINIGKHEVAFTELPAKGQKSTWHFLVMDNLIHEYPATVKKLSRFEGEIKKVTYKSAAERAVSLSFFGDLSRAQEVLELPGISRAMIAYWHDRLISLRKGNSKSLFARFHDYDAAYELLNFKRARENVFSRDQKKVKGIEK